MDSSSSSFTFTLLVHKNKGKLNKGGMFFGSLKMQ